MRSAFARGAQKGVVWIRCSGLLGAVSGIVCFATIGTALAFERKDCEQEDMAWLALRACTALLEVPDVNSEDRVRMLTRRGFAWLIEDEPLEAADDFSRAIKLDPAYPRARTGRARAYTVLEKHEQAAADWSVLIEQDTSTAVSEGHYLQRGLSWLAAGKTDLALADFTKATEINPKSIDGYIGRANVYVALKDREKALSEFERAQQVDPRHFAPYLARAEAAELWGDITLAIENYSKALSLKTTVWTARKSLKRLGIDTPP